MYFNPPLNVRAEKWPNWSTLAKSSVPTANPRLPCSRGEGVGNVRREAPDGRHWISGTWNELRAAATETATFQSRGRYSRPELVSTKALDPRYHSHCCE